jgi:glutathione S-transferase
VLEDHLVRRDYFVGDSSTIADISTWGWIDRAPSFVTTSCTTLMTSRLRSHSPKTGRTNSPIALLASKTTNSALA